VKRRILFHDFVFRNRLPHLVFPSYRWYDEGPKSIWRKAHTKIAMNRRLCFLSRNRDRRMDCIWPFAIRSMRSSDRRPLRSIRLQAVDLSCDVDEMDRPSQSNFNFKNQTELRVRLFYENDRIDKWTHGQIWETTPSFLNLSWFQYNHQYLHDVHGHLPRFHESGHCCALDLHLESAESTPGKQYARTSWIHSVVLERRIVSI
jgi:hypothetical protein